MGSDVLIGSSNRKKVNQMFLANYYFPQKVVSLLETFIHTSISCELLVTNIVQLSKIISRNVS